MRTAPKPTPDAVEAIALAMGELFGIDTNVSDDEKKEAMSKFEKLFPILEKHGFTISRTKVDDTNVVEPSPCPDKVEKAIERLNGRADFSAIFGGDVKKRMEENEELVCTIRAHIAALESRIKDQGEVIARLRHRIQEGA